MGGCGYDHRKGWGINIDIVITAHGHEVNNLSGHHVVSKQQMQLAIGHT